MRPDTFLIFPVIFGAAKSAFEEAAENNLGDGIRFVVGKYDYSTTLRSDIEQLGNVENIESSGECCSSCRARYPATQMFNMFKSHPVRGTCSCLRQVSSQPVTVYRPRSPTKESTIGICGTQNFEVDGALGPGMDFDVASVYFLDYVDDTTNSFLEPIQDSSMCCQRCWASRPETQLYLYTDQWKGCTCYETRPERRPITYADQYFAGGCGCNGGAHGIKCCDEGFTLGDNAAPEEVFIQADKYETNCLKTCKNLYPNSTGITEQLKQTYASGNGKNKKKCWCNFGEPKRDPQNKEYQSCVFRR